MDYHLITHNGVYLIHSDTMTTRKSQAQIDAERREFILAKKQLIPTGLCNFCGWSVPKLALWCSSGCAQDFAREKSALVP